MTRKSAGGATIWRDDVGRIAVAERYEEHLAAWPVPVRRHEIDTAHGRTFALTCGAETAPAVVLLHGAGANSSVWSETAAALATDHRVIMIDLLGEPGFSAAVRPDLTTSASADWLGQVLDRLDVAEAGMAGISFGGWTTVDFAARHPDRVRRMVLICPAGIGKQATWGLAGAFLLQLFGAAGRRRSAAMIAGLDPERDAEVLDEIGLAFRSFQPRTERYPVLDDAALQRLTMPVLAILGERDRVFDPVGTRRRLSTLLPHSRVHLEPGAGHAILGQAERTAEFLRG